MTLLKDVVSLLEYNIFLNK